jgi:hypothetical protein
MHDDELCPLATPSTHICNRGAQLCVVLFLLCMKRVGTRAVLLPAPARMLPL